MGLTLEQLVALKTKEEHADDLLLAMRGVGYVQKRGPGEGSITLDGAAEDNLEVVITIVTEGSLGTAEFRYSLDGGDTDNGSDILVPSGGNYVLPGSGVTITFENGPGIAADSFLDGDEYSFSLTVPTLPVTSWQPGSTVLTIVQVDAAANEDLSTTQQNLAKSAFLSTSENSWLDLNLKENYDTERVQGQTAQHTVRLTDAASSGPHSITPGQLTVATATGLRFSNTGSGTLTLGGTLDLTFEAEQRGTAYNAGIGAINTLLTSLPGVGVSNIDVGNGTSLVRAGVNRETDAAARTRARQQWATLGTGATEDAWKNWAKDASADVTRTLVKADPVTPGNTLLIIAGPAGPVSGGVVTTVQAALADRPTFGSVLTVESAVAQAIAIEATVYVRAGFAGTALAAINANLEALFNGGTNSHDEELEGLEISDGTVKLYRTDIIEQIQIVAGVRNVDLATLLPAAAETTIADEFVATLSPAPDITIVEV